MSGFRGFTEKISEDKYRELAKELIEQQKAAHELMSKLLSDEEE